MANPSDLIQRGDYVIVKMHDEVSTCIIKVDGDQKICRSKVSTKGLVGAPYGTVFQVSGRQLVCVEDTKELDMLDVPVEYFASDLPPPTSSSSSSSSSSSGGPGDDEGVVAGDNRGYVDSNTAQRLKPDDIKQMRAAGASGKTIIQNLIRNSDTWAAKTEFAQEKWLKRKQKKYVRLMRIIKACPRTVCEVYVAKNRDKVCMCAVLSSLPSHPYQCLTHTCPVQVCGLRWDTLAQMLSFSGLHAGSRALVFDGVLGLVVGACAYRMRGHGTVLAAFDGQQPHFTVVDMLNLRAEDLNVIQTVPSEELAPAADNVRAQGFVQCTPEEVARQDAEAQALAAAATQAAAAVKAAHHPELVADAAVSQRVRNAKPHQGCGRQYEPVARVRRELRAGATCLIIASRHHPLSVLQECLALLVPSSPFVVYCEHVQPLVACYLHVTERRLAVKVRPMDTLTRPLSSPYLAPI
jgi:tRNA (adenine-N(1)-)-methyltransferase non-catalytic subunit